jgi:hypothetical protein
MPKREKQVKLDKAFSAAYRSVKANVKQLNALDGNNGNHGTNMAANLKVIRDSIKANPGQAPSDQLRQAAESLRQSGKGGTAQHYANGLTAAAANFEGKQSLNQNDIPNLLQNLMGNVPVQSGTPRPQAHAGAAPQASPMAAFGGGGAGGGADVLTALLGMSGMAGGGGAAGIMGGSQGQTGGDLLSAMLGGGMPTPQQQQPQGGGDLLSAMLGGGMPAPQQPNQGGGDLLSAMLGGGQAPQQQPSGPGDLISSLVPDKPGFDLADLLQAGAAFMGAQAQGADTGGAAMQAVMAAMRSGQVDPLLANDARTASGGLVAQGLLQGVFGKK